MKITLSRGKYALVDTVDYESVSRFTWNARKTISDIYYAQSSIYIGSLDGKPLTTTMLLHRLIMRPPKGMIVDHINHDGLDCRRENMRICSYAQNGQNRRGHTYGTSCFKGVNWNEQAQRWRAHIRINNTTEYLGQFMNEIDAAKAYNENAVAAFGQFACLNTL